MSVVKENAGEILENYLEDHGIKQKFVAESIGVSSATFSSRLKGRLKFDADFAIAVARVLNIDVNIFLK